MVDRKVRYVGSAERLASRLASYLRHQNRRHQISESSKKRRVVHTEMREALYEGHEVEIFAFAIPRRPTDCNGLPIDPLLGIEAGLIMTLKPTWNRRGAVFTVEAPTPD
jgi:hypothetical protein